MRLHVPSAAVVACLAAVAPVPRASADFVEIVVQRKTVDDFNRNLIEEVGMPGDLSVWRVFARFDDPNDQCVGVVGSSQHPFAVGTQGGTGFFNAGVLDSDVPPTPKLALVFDELNYDSWFTVGTSLAGETPPWPSGAPSEDQIIISAGTPGPDTDPWPEGGNIGINMAWLVQPFDEDPGSGEVEPNPRTVAGNHPGNKVLIMQLVADRDAIIEGTFGLLVFTPEPAEIGASFATLPLCLGDTNDDAVVDVEDIINVILAWGSDDPAADVDGNGVVNVEDLIVVVLNPGPC